ncbi:hypothetical protein NE237_022902 [Protea cynaroides]|uniref:Uncharacterized protein n=1 Tax=Protea cynaroides TaxID=273540 RepID=A0A9Q0HDX3_9MAGN|nr:hypothetical protein NE237_022902 [Protea cynaroides]
MKVKKGWLAVTVGLEDDEAGHQRFVIPISYLYHPLFKRLLEKAQEVYGYHTTGPLRLPCSVDDFLHLRWRIEREPNNHQFLQLHGAPVREKGPSSRQAFTEKGKQKNTRPTDGSLPSQMHTRSQTSGTCTFFYGFLTNFYTSKMKNTDCSQA